MLVSLEKESILQHTHFIQFPTLPQEISTCTLFGCSLLVSRPALILSWVIPGNIYPVTEDHRGPKSLLGTAMKSGYSSHYALTTKDGHCCPKKLNVGEYYDELVYVLPEN